MRLKLRSKFKSFIALVSRLISLSLISVMLICSIGLASTWETLLQQATQQDQAGQTNAAIVTLQTALQQTGLDRKAEAQLRSSLAAMLLNLERYQEAVTVLEALLPIAQSSNNKSLEAQSASNLGIAYRNLGRYDRAIKLQKQAGRLFFQLGDRRSLGQALLNLGNTFEALGDYDRASTTYEQSLKIARRFNDLAGEGIVLANQAGIASNLGKDQPAIDLMQKSLAIQETLKDPLGQARSLAGLGILYHAQRDLDKALSHYERALRLAQTAQSRKLEAELLSKIAIVQEDRQQFPAAISTHANTVAIAQTLNDPEILAITLNNQGHTLLAAKQLKPAAQSLQAAAQLLDGLRPGLSDTYKVSLFETQLFTYNLLQQIFVADGQPEKALEASEQGRARAFAELLAQRHNPSQKSLPPITLEAIRRIAKTQNSTLVEYTIIPDDEFKFRGKQKGKGQTLLIWVVQPDGKITLRSVDLKSRWATQGSLNQIVSAARCLEPIPICPTLAERLSLNQPPPNYPKNAIPGLPELYEILIQPIADLLPQKPQDRVVFIPHESLFMVPFAALMAPNGEYLIQSHTIAMVPSIQILDLAAANNPTQVQGTVILGNPKPMPQGLASLPSAETEAIAIAQTFGIPPLLGLQATKANLLAQLPQARLIHLATHGLLEYGQTDALESPGAIALAQTANDAGLLTVKEILQLDLQAEMVVLSACDTGRGKVTGDGVLGLGRAWMAAGASNLVVSLWAVNDVSTAYLMQQFYQELQRQDDRAVALRQAMLTTQQKYPAPRDWAAFVMMGVKHG